MIIDKLLQVSENQTITNGGYSTHIIDFGQARPDIGMDERSKMVITVNETVAASGSPALIVQIQESHNSGASWQVAASSRAYTKAELPAGAQIVIPMPTRLRRYCRIYYAVSGGPLTAGKFSAQIVTGIQQNDPYPDSPRIA